MTSHAWQLIFVSALLFAACGCRNRKDEAEASSVEAPEVTPGVVQLDSAQQQRLGMVLASVRNETVHSTLPAVGWFMAPPAAEIVIRAPLTGFVMITPNQEWPMLGQQIDSAHAFAHLNVFLSPQEISQMVQVKEDNDIQMQQALITMELSEAQLKLVSASGDAVSGARLNQLKEAYEHAKSAYKESQDKIPFLIQEPYENGFFVKPVSIEASRAGRILQAHVTPGQFVQTGDLLWTVADWSTLWLRVPVFAGDAQRIDPSQAAEVRDRLSGSATTGKPIPLPTAMKPDTRTIDIYYAINNPDWKLRVGQSTTVELPIADEEQVLTIPRSAVLFDGFGHASCYASEADRTQFTRRRIELGARHMDHVVVLRGLDDDDVVVSVGAEQLAAEEARGELAMQDND